MDQTSAKENCIESGCGGMVRPGGVHAKRMAQVSLVLVLGCVTANCVLSETAKSAEAFADSVGINVHLSYTDSAYVTKFDVVRDALVDLHVHHLREGLVEAGDPAYFSHLHELGQLGFKAIFITTPDQGESTLESFPARVGPIFEGYEAPNEFDQSRAPDWTGTLRSYMGTLHTVSTRMRIPVIGPSLTKPPSFALLGDVSTLITYGNLHNYPAGRHPGTHGWGANGYGSLTYNVANVERYAGDLPVMTTETGYTNDAGASNAVTEELAAKYLPRLIAYQFSAGISRTYIYELLSSGHEDFGILSRDARKRPAYFALEELMKMADDRTENRSPGSLDLHISGGNGDVQHLLLQKADGSFLLLIWIEASGYDVPHAAPVDVAAQNVTLTLPWTPHSIVDFQWGPGGAVTHRSIEPAALVSVPVSDYMSVVELVPGKL